MENENNQQTVEAAAEEMRRISALCDMLSGLDGGGSNIPAESLCYTMALIRDMLGKQAMALDALSWPVGKVVAA